MTSATQYKCRECAPSVRRRCIQEAQLSPAVRRIIAQAFESHTDTQDTWDLLRRNCLLVLRDQMRAGHAERQEHGLLKRLRQAQEEPSPSPEPTSPEPAAIDPSAPEPGWEPNWEAELRAAGLQEANGPPRFPSTADGEQAPEAARTPGPGAEETSFATPAQPSPTAPPTQYLSGSQEARATARIDESRLRRRVTEGTRPIVQLHYPRVARPQPDPDLAPGPRMLVALVSGHRIRLSASGSLILGRFDPITRVTPDVDLTFEDRHNHSVSRHHAQIGATEGRYEITDMGSSNGTWINGERLPPRARQSVQVGDEIQLGGCRLFFDQVPACWQDARPEGQFFFYVTFSGHFVPLPDRDTILIGRQDPAQRYRPDIDLSHEGGIAAVVSRRHARMTRDRHQFLIEDLGSAYQTRINGQTIPVGEQVPLEPGQHLWLGGCTLAFDMI